MDGSDVLKDTSGPSHSSLRLLNLGPHLRSSTSSRCPRSVPLILHLSASDPAVKTEYDGNGGGNDTWAFHTFSSCIHPSLYSHTFVLIAVQIRGTRLGLWGGRGGVGGGGGLPKDDLPSVTARGHQVTSREQVWRVWQLAKVLMVSMWGE